MGHGPHLDPLVASSYHDRDDAQGCWRREDADISEAMWASLWGSMGTFLGLGLLRRLRDDPYRFSIKYLQFISVAGPEATYAQR